MFQRTPILAVLLLSGLTFDANQAHAQSEAEKRGPLPPDTASHLDLDYVGDGLVRQKLDLFVPKSDKPVPLVVWVHGGAWITGSKENSSAMMLLDKGFAVANINYRLSGTDKFPAQIHDCKAAVRFLRANAEKYNIAPDSIGSWGSSAGGHLAALLGTSGGVAELEGDLGKHKATSGKVQAVCDCYGPTDFTKFRPLDKADSPEGKLVGGTLRDKKELVASANPIAHVTKDDPPFLIVHGTKDGTVPIGQSELLDKALRTANVSCTFMRIEVGGHDVRVFQSAESRKAIVAFFEKHLKSAK